MPAVPTRMHADELEIDDGLVRRLLARQFPAWAGLPIRALPFGGTDNAIYRLGDGLSVRLPRRGRWTSHVLDKEFAWLPRLAPLLPLAVPTPVARGAPGAGYPHEWAVYDWLDGEDATTAPLDPARAAVDLAGFIRALQAVDPKDAPPAEGRGGPLAPHDAGTRAAIEQLGDSIDAAAATAVWEKALAAPGWDRPPVWIHGDLDARNLLVGDGRITGVLDWSAVCAGDPACDVKAAFAVLDAGARPVFRRLLDVDDATWARARGWAVSQAVIALPYYLDTYPAIVAEARRWLSEALADDG